MTLKRSERAIMQENRRSTNRQTMRLPLERAWVHGNPIDAVILDLSVAGVLLETPAELKVGDILQIEVPEHGMVATEVMWRRDNLFGCQFEREVSNAAISAAMLKSSTALDRPELVETAEAVARLPKAETFTDETPRKLRRRHMKLAVIAALAVIAWGVVLAIVRWIA